MGDTDRQPGKRTFEPPPWEREQFEELARRRQERERREREEAAAEATAATMAAASAALAGVAASPAQPAETEAPGSDADRPAPEAGQDERLDESQVQAMLVQLSGEDPQPLQPIRRASKVVALVVGAVGLGTMVTSGILGVRASAAGPIGVVSAGTGIVLGAGIAGIAAWLWLRALR
jgi:hypothetical protein